ncbi:hypothetical protein SUGI_1141970 [Cryptomeria japonica]|nr:hypothetical protein SUGI_1141970 [Cryptomeria japonica]
MIINSEVTVAGAVTNQFKSGYFQGRRRCSVGGSLSMSGHERKRGLSRLRRPTIGGRDNRCQLQRPRPQRPHVPAPSNVGSHLPLLQDFGLNYFKNLFGDNSIKLFSQVVEGSDLSCIHLFF